MNVLVACVGNIFQGDDAFGCEVARELSQRPQRPNVRVVDFGIRGLDLTYALMDAPELTILVDAMARGGSPGTLYTIEPDLTENGLKATGQSMLDAHVMDPVNVLLAVKSLSGVYPPRVLLVACEPADLGGAEGRMGLTPQVLNAIRPAADIVESLIEKEQQVSI